MSRVRDDVMWALAYNLAQSGEYAGWWDIAAELEGQEFSRARQLLPGGAGSRLSARRTWCLEPGARVH